jgi:hypothetical protein
VHTALAQTAADPAIRISSASERINAGTLETNRCRAGLVFEAGITGACRNSEQDKMCDYSLGHLRSRPAQVADQLTTHDFGTGTRGFCAAQDSAEDPALAVCILPGTELSFAEDVKILSTGLFPWRRKTIRHRTAIFRQINKDKEAAHHDALEFPDGKVMLLTLLCEGQKATVLQLPARPNTAEEVRRQMRIAHMG